MKYQPKTIYHIFNQGNNKQEIFYREENYLFFLKKMRKHILPYAEFLSYCLMPNHFHWLVYTKPEACELSPSVKANRKWTDEFKSSDHSEKYQQNLSHQIKTLLSSYTRAINRQENRTGSLFRQKTKVKDGVVDGVITIDGKNKDLSSAREYDGNHSEALCNLKLAKELLHF